MTSTTSSTPLDLAADALHAASVPFDNLPNWLTIRAERGTVVVSEDEGLVVGVYEGDAFAVGLDAREYSRDLTDVAEAIEAVRQGVLSLGGLTYADACKRAATLQGLDTVVEALTAAGLPAEVEQTGGFTMVATVYCAEGALVVTDDGVDEPAYLLGVYPGEAWTDGEDHDDEVGMFSGLTLDELLAEATSSARALGGVK